MEEVFLSFEGTDREGKIAVGSYISDAGRRFGLRDSFACDPEAHVCEVKIISGLDLLSEMTAFEKQYFPEKKIGGEFRLGCHTKIEKPGEIVIMASSGQEKHQAKEAAETDKAAETNEKETTASDYEKRFTELPLEKKMAELVRLEAIAFSETVGFVINSPFSVVGKVFDLLAEFGFKKEEDQKASMRPDEHLKEEAVPEQEAENDTSSEQDPSSENKEES